MNSRIANYLFSPKVGPELHILDKWPLGAINELTLTLCSSQQSCGGDVAENGDRILEARVEMGSIGSLSGPGRPVRSN